MSFGEPLRRIWRLLLRRLDERRRYADVMRRAQTARVRFQARNARLAREAAEQAAKEAAERDRAASPDAVAAAIARAKTRRAAQDEHR